MAGEGEAPRSTIYLVDDMPENLEMLSRRLAPLGYDISTFTDGAEALQTALAAPPDLFILDVNMPGLDGFEVCAIIKDDPKLQDIPVMFISAAGDMKAKLMAFERGGADYISKPFHFPEVAARVRAQLELRSVQRRYLDAKLAAEHASQAKDRFIASVSHELRTPLNSVLGMAEVLLDETFGPLNDKQRSYVGFIYEGGEHLLRQVNDLLEVAFADAGATRLQPEPMDLVASIHWVAGCLSVQLTRKRISISLPAESSQAAITADETRVRQILMNLLGNAVENTPEDGKMSVVVLPDPDGATIRVEVSDTGPGVPPEDRGRVFLEFERSRLANEAQRPGRGLGLAIARRLVLLHGGAIGVVDAPGGGSTFWFSLPVNPRGNTTE